MRHPGGIAAVCALLVVAILLPAHETLAAPGGIWGARIRVVEPKSGVVRRGHAATLECQFELQEGSQLYMVQWYRGSREFYRHVPSETPPSKLFPIEGLQVDLSRSDTHRVRINGSGFALAGNYSCEISADAPSYSTATVTHELKVIVVPPRPPALVIERGDYEPNDVLRANCTAGPARPAPTLTFYINDVPVGSEWTKQGAVRVDVEGLESSRLEIVLTLRPPHVQRPESTLRLRCESRVTSTYVESAMLVLNPRRIKHVNQPRPERDFVAVTSPNGSEGLRTFSAVLLFFTSVTSVMLVN